MEPIGNLLKQYSRSSSSDTLLTRSADQTLPSRISPATIELYKRFGEDGHTALAQFSPDKQTLYCRDIQRCFFGTAPSLGLIKTGYGRNTAESWLEVQLKNLADFAGCKEKLTLEQLTELAQMMLERFGHYKLTEFMLFFQKFKGCEYGRFYGAVDPMIIMQALKTFDEERSRVIDQKRSEEEKEKRDADWQRHKARIDRFKERVPEGVMNFSQYSSYGYEWISDEELEQEVELIRSGKKVLATEARELMEIFSTNYKQRNETSNQNTN